MKNLDLSYLLGRTVRVHKSTGTYHEYEVVGYCVEEDGGIEYTCLVLLDPMNRFGVTVRVLDSNVEIMPYETLVEVCDECGGEESTEIIG